MKNYLYIILILISPFLINAQVTVQISVSNVSVTNFCDMDGFGAGDSDPLWEADVNDNRDNSDDFNHGETDNGPTVSVSSGFDNSLLLNVTYPLNICIPNYVIIDWNAGEDDGASWDAYVSESIHLLLPTSPGSYTATRSIQGFDSDCDPTWHITFAIDIIGTPEFICADDPCDATLQTIQDGCSAVLSTSRYDVGTSENSETTACSDDGDNDIFFKLNAPVSGKFVMYLDDWGDFAGLTQANLGANLYEGSCGSISLANSETIYGANGTSPTIDCIDLSSGVFNDVNNGPFVFENLTIGQDYYLRLSEEDEQPAWADLSFQAILPENECVNAAPLTEEGCNYSANDNGEPDIASWTGGAHTGSFAGDPVQTCGGWSSNENMVWYYFDVTASTVQPISLTVKNINCDNTGGGTLQVGIWSAGTGPTYSCDLATMPGIGCVVGTGTQTIDLATTIPNGRYYVVTDGNAGAQCTWEFESLQLVLPVTYTQFTAKQEGKNNRLEWQTSTEQNNDLYEIERSTSEKTTWENIGSVEAVGNSTEITRYNFVDNNPDKLNYYRLKQIDIDGEFSYSKTISVIRKSSKIKVYPSPTTGKINIAINEKDIQLDNIQVFDISGKKVFTKILNKGIQNIYNINIEMLPNGVYYLKVGNEDNMHKVVKN